MAEPRTLVAGRYAFLGSLITNPGAERWLGVEQESGRRVVLSVVDATRLSTLDSAKGVKHRHLTGVIEIVREVEASSVPSGRALSAGAGIAVAELVPGKTLHAELGNAGMNPAKAVAWMLRLADALQALHAAGAVHTALSPRSVVAVPEGRAIAPVLSQLLAPALGAYCPPERLKGSADSAPDDVWALHATLYSALTRQAPYVATTRDGLLKQMLSARPKPLSAFGIDEPALQEILDRGLAYERRVRVTDLPELVASLDGWERDPGAMPAKRQVTPRPATRSLMDIVGATGLKDRDDGIVIDASNLPDDDGSTAIPKTAAPPPVLPSSPSAARSSAPNAASAPALPQLPPLVAAEPSRDALSSAPTFAASVLPGVGDAPTVPKRVSINPFERKRSVWPLVLVAAIAGGGGVYLAVAPDAAQPAVTQAAEPTSPLPTPKPAAPERPKLSPSATRDACVVSYFEPGSFDPKQDFGFLCSEGDFRELAATLHLLASTAGADAGAADAGPRRSGLDWYELPAAAVIRKSCCEGATPVVLPETPGWCEQLQTVVRRMADNSGKAGDLAPDARSFDKAVACLFANKVRGVYSYDKAPTDANRQAFQQFLSRAAISEARR